MDDFAKRLGRSADRNQSRVILALDVTGSLGRRLAFARRVLEATKDYVAAVKINFQLLLPFGLDGLSDLIGYCAESGLPLIADIKLNDISSTNLDAAEQLYDSGFHAIIANPFVGFRDGLEPIIQYAHSRGEGIILLVYMSHKGASEGYSMRDGSGMPMFLLFAQRAKRWHADGVIVSAKSPQKIRAVKSIVGDQVLVLSPGVGAQGGDARKAFDAGAEFIIVGRTVLESSDPGRTIRGLNYFPHRASF